MPHESSFQTKTDRVREFLEVAGRIQELASSWGVRIRPFADPSLPHFSRLPSVRQDKVLDALRTQREFFELAQIEGFVPDSPQLIWRALKRLGLTPEPDLFGRLGEEDTVEVYLNDGTSCFKNLTFFRYITISLEELFVLPFHRLYSFSPQGGLYFMEILIRLKTGLVRRTFQPTFSNYVLQEILGERRKVRIRLKWLSPLRRDGVAEAIMAINRSSFADEDARVGEIRGDSL